MVDITPNRRSSATIGLTIFAVGAVVGIAVLVGVVMGVRWLVLNTDWFVPVLLMILKGLVLLVALLMHRLHPAGGSQNLGRGAAAGAGPTSSAPFGLLQILRGPRSNSFSRNL